MPPLDERDTIEVSHPGADSEDTAMVRAVQKDINASSRKWDHAFRVIKESRRAEYGWVLGQQSRANLIHATNVAMLPLLYAKNPEFSVKPKEVVVAPGSDEYQITRKYAETMEIVIKQVLNSPQAGLKRNAKRAVRAVQSSKIGWLKCTFQRDIETDPAIETRLSDVTQDIERLRGMQMNLQDESMMDHERLRVQEEQMMRLHESLTAAKDVEVSKGFVADFVDTLDIRMDPTKNLQDYRSARWIAHRSWFDRATAQERFLLTEKELAGIKWYTRDGNEQYRDASGGGGGYSATYTSEPVPVTGQTAQHSLQERQVMPVWERWDQATKTVYTFGEGLIDRWLRPAYQPQRVGQRWYPFFMVGWGWVDGEDWPLSDVELLIRLQDEYNATREQQDKHREASKPFWVADRSTKEADIERFEHPQIGSVIVVDANGNPVNQMFVPAQAPPWNPAIYDTTQIRSDFEWVSGLQDAQRGGVQQAKTLGEAELVQQGLNDRVSEKKDIIEEVFEEMAIYTSEITLWEYTYPEIKVIAGPNAVWPWLVNSQVVDAISVEIRADSTVKPNKQRDQKVWIEFLPILQQTIDAVMQARQMGLPDEVNPYMRIAEETLKRFDERFDIEAIIPPMDMNQQQSLQAQYLLQQPGMAQAMLPGQPGMGPPGMQPGMGGPGGPPQRPGPPMQAQAQGAMQ